MSPRAALITIAVAAACAVPACTRTQSAEHGALPTFTRDVAPILSEIALPVITPAAPGLSRCSRMPMCAAAPARS